MKKLLIAIGLSGVLMTANAQPGPAGVNLAGTIYLEACRYHLLQTQDLHTIFEIHFLNASFEKSASLSQQNATAALNDFRKGFAQLSQAPAPGSYYAGYSRMQNALLTPNNALSPTQQSDLTLCVASINNIFLNTFTNKYPTGSFGLASVLYTFDSTLVTRALRQAYHLAATNANYRAVFNNAFAAALGHHTADSADQILLQDTAFAASLSLGRITNLIIGRNLTTVTAGTLDTGFSVTLAHLKDLSNKSNQVLKLHLQKGKSGLNGVQQPNNPGDIKSVTDLQIQSASASVGILSNLALAMGNSKLSNQLSVVGGNTINMVKAIVQFDDITQKFRGDGGFLLGGIMLSGNLFAAALNILNVFGVFGSGPSPDQLIMQGLQGISDEIDSLYTQMNVRFDDIDWKLDTIYSTMVNGLSVISQQNQLTHEMLTTMGQSMSNLQQEVLYYNMDLTQILDQLYCQPLQQNLALVNDRAANEAIAFTDVRDLFINWGLRLSKTYNPIQTINFGVTNNANLYTSLTGMTSDLSFNFINGILQAQFGTNLSADPLPDPNIWLLASNGLLKLASKWPGNTIDPAKIDQLITTGQSLLDFQTQLKYYYQGDSLHYSMALIDSVLNAYQSSCLNFLHTQVRAADSLFQLTYCKGINPFFWRDTIGKIPYRPKSYPASFSVETGYSKAFVDTNFLYKLVPDAYRFASYAGITSISFQCTCQPVLQKPGIWYNANPPLPPGRPDNREKNLQYSPPIYSLDNITVGATASYDQASIPVDHSDQFISLGTPDYTFQNHTGSRNTDYVFPIAFYTNTINTYQPPLVSKLATFYACADPCTQVSPGRQVLQAGLPKLDSILTARYRQYQTYQYSNLIDLLSNPSTSDLYNHLPAQLDYYYLLVKDLFLISFPNSMAGDDSLANYFYGNASLLSSDNMARRLEMSIDRINQKDTAGVYIYWSRLVKANVAALKAYTERKLQTSLVTQDYEPLDAIAMTIKNLQLLKTAVSARTPAKAH